MTNRDCKALWLVIAVILWLVLRKLVELAWHGLRRVLHR